MRYFVGMVIVCVLALLLAGCNIEGCNRAPQASNPPTANDSESKGGGGVSKATEWDLSHWSKVGLWVIGIVGLATAIMAVISARETSPAAQRIPKLTPSFFFWLGMTYLAILLLIAILYNAWDRPSPVLIGRILPVAVPWFGALGAVTISLDGVFRRNAVWDSRYNYWHIGRPLFGATLGIVAFFIFLVLIKAAGTPPRFLEPTANPAPPATGQVTSPDEPSPPGEGGPGPARRDLPTSSDFIVFYILAFLVGYREETFSELIKRVTDLILKPGQVTPVPGPQITIRQGGIPAEQIAMEDTTAGQTSETTLEIRNTGDGPLDGLAAAVNVTPPAPATTFSVQLVGAGELPPGQSRDLTIRFAPLQPGQFSGTLIVTAANSPERRTIQLSGAGV